MRVKVFLGLPGLCARVHMNVVLCRVETTRDVRACLPLLPPRGSCSGFLCGAQRFSREAHLWLRIWSGSPRPVGGQCPAGGGSAAAVFTACPLQLRPHAPQLCYILDSLLKTHVHLSFPHVFLEYSVQGKRLYP